MAESRNRDLATSLGQAVKNNTITSTGSLAVVGLTAYDSAGLLPSSYDSANAGTLGFAEDSDKLYIHTGQGWFNIAIINTTPIFTASPSVSYDLAADATAYKNGTATVITLAARDSEGFPVTFSASGNSAFNNIAHVDKDSANGFIFTVEPKSADSVGENLPADGTLTFSVTDGVNTASAASTFSLRFDTSVANSESTSMFAAAIGNNLTDQNLTGLDQSDSGHSVTAITDAQLTRLSAFTPFASPGNSCMIGYNSGAGTDNTHFVKIRNGSKFAFGAPSGNTNDFTIECWVYPLEFSGSHGRFVLDMRGTANSNNAIAIFFQPTGQLYGRIANSSVLGGGDRYVQFNEWNHIAIVRHGTNITMYLNGVECGSKVTGSSTDFNYTTSTGNTSDIYIGRTTPADTGNTHPGSSGTTNQGRFTGYVCDFRIVRGTAIYTAEFTPPTTALETVSNTILHLFKKNVPFLFGMSTHSAHTTHSHGSSFLRSGGAWPSSDTSAGSSNTPMIVNHTPYKTPEQWSASTHGGSLESRSRVGVAGHSDFQFGNSTPFTIELWACFSQNYGNLEQPILDNRTSSGTGFYIHYDADGKIKVAYGTTSSHTDLVYDTSAVTAGSGGSPFTCWTHIAYCFDGTTHRLFINGDAKTTSSTSVNYNSSGQLKIGSETNEVWIGPMRIINGTAVYGTAYNFFPPIGLFTKTGSTYFSLKDPFSGSSGNTSVNNSVPASHTKLLINWANTLGLYQTTGNVWFNQSGISSTSAGGVTSSTGSQKYSVSSLLFDRTDNDRINYPNNHFSEHQKAIGKSERHCFEAWVQWSGSATTQYGNNPTILVLQQTNTSTHYSNASESDLSAKVDNGGKLRLFIGSNRLDDSSSNLVIDHHSGNILDGNWHHVALVRNNDTVYLFVDGVQGTSTGTTNSKMYASWGGLGGTNYQRNDGSNGTPGGSPYFVYGGGWNGYMSQVRRSRGNHRYPFFPKKETLTTSTSFQNGITVTASNTKLLCCHHSTATTDGSSNQTITVNGTPAVSSWAPNGGMKSIYFDGNSGNASSLTTGNTADFAWGTGDVTIEMWAYFNGGSAFTNGYPYLIDFTDGDTQGLKVYTENNQKIRFYANSTADESDIVFVTHRWYHIAAVRQSQVWYLYVNGSQDTGIALSDNINYGNTQATIGGRYNNNGYNHIGYISNVRVVKGQAIYTKDFTPPSEAMYG